MRAAALGAAAVAAVGLGACGGGGERQDADEPAGTFQVAITDASFPAEQHIAERATLKIGVRNNDSKTVPNVAMTLQTAPEKPGGAGGAFARNVDDRSLADPSRPIWILDEGPAGSETAYTNTWALGPLEPGEARTFEWRVTAVKAGSYTVDYKLAAGLDGKARLGGGGTGSFDVTIDDTPPDSRVDENNNVVRSDPDSDEQ